MGTSCYGIGALVRRDWRDRRLAMAEGTIQGILLVADISGYTDFVRQHARSASHARQITVRLLKAIVSAASPPLSVAELEGE